MAATSKRRRPPHERAVGDASLATVLRRRRAALDLRQDELADLAGVSERFVHSVEAGKATVQLDKLLAVLDAVGLHLEVHPGARGAVVAGKVGPEA